VLEVSEMDARGPAGWGWKAPAERRVARGVREPEEAEGEGEAEGGGEAAGRSSQPGWRASHLSTFFRITEVRRLEPGSQTPTRSKAGSTRKAA